MRRMEEESPSILSHVSVGARDLKRAVAFYDAVLPVLGEPYYGAFVRDLDGHKIEAAFWDESLGEHA